MAYQMYIPDDLYLIPSEEDAQYLLYRPSRRVVTLLDPSLASHLYQTIQGHSARKVILGPEQEQYLSPLIRARFFDSVRGAIPITNLGTARPVDTRSQSDRFVPHEVTLDITRKCNMKCVYCYASAGETKTSMRQDCAQSAIDLCISNAKDKGTFLGLHFHGGGESSQEFELLSSLYSYAEARCGEEGVTLKCSVITNGLIPRKVMSFYAKSMDELTLSLDGDEVSHDAQRPSVKGHPTFRYVFRTGKELLQRRKPFNIRTTITSKNVQRLGEIVQFLIQEFPGCTLSIEPVALVGRAFGQDDLACDPVLFADHVFSAMKVAMNAGAILFYSGVSGHSERKEFCAASAPNFCVSADGSVTSCFSYSNRDIVKSLFVYGRFDSDSGRFLFNFDKVRRLQSLTVEHDSYCQKCFCRTHCMGDCPALRRFEWNGESSLVEQLDTEFGLNRRCGINRRVVTLLLNDIARGRIKLPLSSSETANAH